MRILRRKSPEQGSKLDPSARFIDEYATSLINSARRLQEEAQTKDQLCSYRIEEQLINGVLPAWVRLSSSGADEDDNPVGISVTVDKSTVHLQKSLVTDLGSSAGGQKQTAIDVRLDRDTGEIEGVCMTEIKAWYQQTSPRMIEMLQKGESEEAAIAILGELTGIVKNPNSAPEGQERRERLKQILGRQTVRTAVYRPELIHR